ncbi:MAG: hypothetical protein ACRDZ5_12500, partial [Acidimicrobiales bacterium]
MGPLPRARPSASRLLGLSLLRKALLWRAGSSAAFLAVAIVAVAAATAGPVYLASADQSVLTNVLSPAPPEKTGLVVAPQPGSAMRLPVLERAVSGLPRSPDNRPWWARPIYTEIIGVSARAAGRTQAVSGDLVWRSLICRHLHMTAGRCPSSGAGVAISSRTAGLLRAKVGTLLDLGRREEVVGIYRVSDVADPYYWGQNYFPFGTGSNPSIPTVDSLFGSRATLAVFAGTRSVAVSADVPLLSGNLRAPDVPRFEAALSKVQSRLGAAFSLSATSSVGSLLSSAESQQSAMATSVAVIDLELMLLVLLVLYGVAAGTSTARE